jgi:hypothetical protein
MSASAVAAGSLWSMWRAQQVAYGLALLQGQSIVFVFIDL